MPTDQKIYTQVQELLLLLEDFRKEDKKVVFTNGCFDLLHPGHVDILQKARALGDVLIVGLNSDESIAGLKGPSRPIQNLEARSLVLSGLGSVDYIIPFNEPTPLKLIRLINPDILVKGGDYELEKIVGFEHVKNLGGVVKTIPFLEGYSTSRIIDKIKEETT